MICPKCGSTDVEQIDEECKCNKCGYEGKCEEFKPKDMKEETYKEFFAKKLEKYNVKSPAELSDEESKKFFDEVDTEWEGEKEEIEEGKKTDLFDKALYELSKGNTTEFISIVKDAMFIEVGSNDKYPRKV